MPLFGSHKHDNNTSHGTRHDQDHLANNRVAHPNAATGVTGGNLHNAAGAGANVGIHGNPNIVHDAYAAPTQGYNGHEPLNSNHNNAQLNHGANDPYSDAGVGRAPNLPPSGVVNDSHQSHSGSGHAFSGKVEHAVGTLIGSHALKAKGLQKEQEANSIKIQGQELAEAERLEREALMRRERAVGHGAHPDNKHLGAGTHGAGGARGGGAGYT